MIAKFRHSLQHDQFGQAIILGVACLLVIVVGIMSTAQLGWAVKERIQLQDAADNVVYTTAVAVARSLNLISWTNRAIIAQYVAAMAFQSYMGFLDGVNTMVGQVAAMLLSFAFILGIIAKIPIIGWFVQPFASGIGIAGKLIKELAEGMLTLLKGIDVVIAEIVQIISFINKAMYAVLQFGAAKALTIAMLAANRTSNSFYWKAINGTAGNSATSWVQTSGDTTSSMLMSALNAKLYTELFDEDGSEDIGDSNNKTTRRAERLMTELVNASRAGNNGEYALDLEVQRGFSVSKALSVGGKAAVILDALTPELLGGTLLAEPKEKRAYYAEDTKVAKEKALPENPVTNSHKYYISSDKDGDDSSGGASLPRGTALISTDFVKGLNENWPSWLNTVTHWLKKASGELIPDSKVMGIQATSDESKQFHCRFSKVSTFSVNMDDLISDMCDDSAEDFNEKGCNKNCKKYCRRYKVDEEGNPTTKCAKEGYEPNTAAQPDADPADLALTCSRCQQVYLPEEDYPASGDMHNGHNYYEDRAREEMRDQIRKECKAAAKEMADAAEEAAAKLENAANEALMDAFSGMPAKVYIECNKDDKANHSFEGISKYASFNIEKYNSKQKAGVEPYPFFMVRLSSQPKFLSAQNSALGFGDAYGSGKTFKVSTMGKVKGPGASDAGKCSDGMGFDCKKGYNFNYISNGEMQNPFGEGFNAWSSSGVYYHRPGTWAEPPNMFNPYWKAKLKPVASTIDYLIHKGSSMDSSESNAGSQLGSMMSGMLESAGLTDIFGTIMAH